MVLELERPFVLDVASKQEIDARLFLDLEQIYQELSQFPHFPHNCTADAIELLQNLGLETPIGWFEMDRRVRKGVNSAGREIWSYKAEVHQWAVGPNGLIIDLLVSRFNPGLNEPIENGVHLIDLNHPLRKRYLSSDEASIKFHMF